jgi:hypothetical protein
MLSCVKFYLEVKGREYVGHDEGNKTEWCQCHECEHVGKLSNWLNNLIEASQVDSSLNLHEIAGVYFRSRMRKSELGVEYVTGFVTLPAVAFRPFRRIAKSDY